MSKNDDFFSLGKGVEAELNGKLRKNNLPNGQQYYLQLDKKVAPLAVQLSYIEENDKSADLPEMKKQLEIYRNAVLKLLKLGYSVRLLDLVTVTPVVRGSVNSVSEAGAKKDVGVRLQSSDLLNDAVKDIAVANIIFEEPKILIENIEDLFRRESDGIITAGKSIAITGDKLKTGGEGDGIYIIRVDSDGNPLVERDEWTKIASEDILHNMPTKVICTIPAGLIAGYYIIRIESRYSSKNPRKEAIYGVSKILTVK